MKCFYKHYTGIEIANDGEVFVPQSGSHPSQYTFGSIQNSGYLYVTYKDKHYFIHRLVAEVFLNGNKPIDGSIYAVHHINGVKTDNRVENLLILTHGEHTKIHFTGENNYIYGKHHSEETRRKMSEAQRGQKNHFFGQHHTEEAKKKISESKKGHLGADCPLSKPVIGINKLTGEVREFAGISEAQRVLGIHNSAICRCLKGKLKSAGGWMWQYA